MIGPNDSSRITRIEWSTSASTVGAYQLPLPFEDMAAEQQLGALALGIRHLCLQHRELRPARDGADVRRFVRADRRS